MRYVDGGLQGNLSTQRGAGEAKSKTPNPEPGGAKLPKGALLREMSGNCGPHLFFQSQRVGLKAKLQTLPQQCAGDSGDNSGFEEMRM